VIPPGADENAQTFRKDTINLEMRVFIFSISVLLYPAAAAPLPPPVHSPEEQQALFQFAEPGYRIELVASEPMVQAPVAIQFDGQGRLWVVEMRGFMRDIDRKDEKKPDGRVSVLEDTDGDGVMDRSTVFAGDLVLPQAILVYSLMKLPLRPGSS